MKSIIKIDEYLSDRNSIVVKICNLHSQKPIDDYTAKIVDCDTNDSITVGDYVGYGVDQSDKGCGKATTYAYKYLLMKLFMMEVGEDEDSEFSNPPVINNKQLGKTEDDI